MRAFDSSLRAIVVIAGHCRHCGLDPQSLVFQSLEEIPGQARDDVVVAWDDVVVARDDVVVARDDVVGARIIHFLERKVIGGAFVYPQIDGSLG
mgnify:CR=1 FL=1